MKKAKYTEPKVEKVEHVSFPGVDDAEDIEAGYTCSGTGWNSGTSRGCLDGMSEGAKAKEEVKK